MLLRQLFMENYGLYSGRHVLDLAPRVKYRRERPIVLIGGKNGAGKTTILEAVRLALYGRTSLGQRVRQQDYDAFLKARVHRTRAAPDRPISARVGIEFDHVIRGESHRYTVERGWTLGGQSSVHEELVIRRDGELLDEIDREHWQSFVCDIVPEGLSQLFFFDGEKIKDLAEDLSGEAALADSIKSLLGLDVVERLQGDLSIYASREITRTGKPADRNELKELRTQESKAADDLDRKQLGIGEVAKDIDEIHREIEKREAELRREGLIFAEDRDRLVEEKGNLSARVDHASRLLREACDGLFPISLCPTTIRNLMNQLEFEDRQRAASFIRHELQETRQAIREIIAKSTAESDEAKKSVSRDIDQFMSRRLSELPENHADPYAHGMSEAQSQRLLGWVEEAETTARPHVHRMCDELERANLRMSDVEGELLRVPNDDMVRPVTEAIRDLTKRLGSLERKRDDLLEQRNQLTAQLATLRSRIEAKLKGYGDQRAGETRIQAVHRIKSALSVYLQRLTEQKVAKLEQTVAESFNRLCRKGDVLRSVSVDPKTFAVTLFNRDGDALAKSELSSGEKQIYAIAMLWALAKTSGRPLPVIIDTPLGRLDSEHRQNLIESYFPHASHQVILLSTDTEVDAELYQRLRSNVSHAYHLEFDRRAGSTTLKEGYFWKGEAHA